MSAKKYESAKQKDDRCCSIIESLRKDRDANESCDIQLLVENSKFNAHRSVLISCSQYFRAMFTGRFKESENGYVELSDISKRDFSLLLDFMYGVEMDFQSKSLDELLSALHLADMFCLDMFTAECKEFVASWREYKNYKVALSLARKLDLKDVETELKSFVFRQLLPTNVAKTFEKLDMETIPYDLLMDALKMFQSSDNNCLDVKPGQQDQLNSVSVLKTKLEGIIAWIALHPGIDMNQYMELLDMSGMEGLPSSYVGQVFVKVLSLYPESSFDEAATAINIKTTKITDSISALKLRLTLVRVIGFSVNLVDYHYDDQRWKDFTFHVGFVVNFCAADENTVFLVGNNELCIFNVKDRTLSKKRELPLTKEQFQCFKVCAENNMLYMYGRNTESNNVILGFYNKTMDDFSRRELKQAFNNDAPSLTIKSGCVYFKNGYQFYMYNPKTNVLTQNSAINSGYSHYLSDNPKMAVLGEDLLLVIRNGSFIRNPSTYNYNLKQLSESAGHYNLSTDVCTTDKEYIIALQQQEFNSELKMLRGDGNQFCSLAFLPCPKGFLEDGAHIIMRQEIL